MLILILLLLCLVVTEAFTYCQLKTLAKHLKKISLEQQEKTPPKSRGSFVVKRMEERVKEALYQ